jgi:aminoglycoside phosphotransferase
VLHGQLGVNGIADLVHNPMQHGLADLLAQCVPGGEQLCSTKLLRTKYKPGRKLTAYYWLHVSAEVRPIALSWYAESQPATLDAADLQDRAAPRHLVAPFVRLTARTESGQIGLLIAPIDPQMPQLMRLNDHSHLAGMLTNLTSDSAPLPEATRIEAVRYRPGQRHVLHISSAPDPHKAALIKIDRDNHGAQAVRFAQAVGPLLSEHSPHTSLVSPLGYSVEDQAAVWRGIAGTTMSHEVRDPAQAARLFSLIGKAVRVLHRLDCQTTTDDMTASQLSAPHLARTELASTLGAGEHLTALMPTLGARYRLLAMEVLERLEDLPEEELRLAHGDLKCDNILTAGDRIYLLDLDRTGLAEPAMDLGKLLADLRWWGQHYSVDVAGLVRKFLEGYGPCDAARISRARLIAVLYQLKLAARRTPVHTTDWGTQVTRQVDEAAASLRGVTTP